MKRSKGVEDDKRKLRGNSGLSGNLIFENSHFISHMFLHVFLELFSYVNAVSIEFYV